MQNETYEQISLGADVINEDQIPYLQDGMTVQIESYEDDPIGIKLPDTVILEIVEADAVVKGQTASSSYKPALLEHGVQIMVSPHIASGPRTAVNTEEGVYVERAKDQ